MTEVGCGEGVWINSSVAQTLSLSGTPCTGTSLSLVAGWNLIGLKGSEQKAIADLVSGKTDKIASVWKWVDNTWAVNLPQSDSAALETYANGKGFKVLSTLDPWEGFWVNATEAITLE